MEEVHTTLRQRLGVVAETDTLLWFVHLMLPLPVEPTSAAVHRRAVYLGLPPPPMNTNDDIPLNDVAVVAAEWLRSIVASGVSPPRRRFRLVSTIGAPS